ncbi:uncharacterized protein LOC124887028 [Capsicum annuum]|uniref:uncharacterized protein LOC124887028 n=1 Tax=Capsicum annuum TaxID=4072 RepID=UPI001FB13B9C|nr:uncharacterized protein LOC124887028 [Capsicum annuum]
MSNIFKREFSALEILDKTYMSSALDAEIHLNAVGLADTIKNDNKVSNQDKAKAMIFLRHHLDEGLKMEYLTIKDSLMLQNNLKEIYDHLKMPIHPQVCYEWTHLRLQDFKNITDYNSAMFRIKLQFNLCRKDITDHDILEKTFSIVPATSMLLQQQYREMEFKKYSKLISHLLIDKQHNDLFMRNLLVLLHEVNAANFYPTKRERSPDPSLSRSRGRGRDHGRDRGRGRDCGRYFNQGDLLVINNNPQHQHCKKKGEAPEAASRTKSESKCYRCGGKGHWLRTYRSLSIW